MTNKNNVMNSTEIKNFNHLEQVTKIKDNTNELDNSLKWIININGFNIDIRKADHNLQLEALEQGLIPYLPSSDNNS